MRELTLGQGEAPGLQNIPKYAWNSLDRASPVPHYSEKCVFSKAPGKELGLEKFRHMRDLGS